jgi:hypothetical protein
MYTLDVPKLRSENNGFSKYRFGALVKNKKS